MEYRDRVVTVKEPCLDETIEPPERRNVWWDLCGAAADGTFTTVDAEIVNEVGKKFWCLDRTSAENRAKNDTDVDLYIQNVETKCREKAEPNHEDPRHRDRTVSR